LGGIHRRGVAAGGVGHPAELRPFRRWPWRSGRFVLYEIREVLRLWVRGESLRAIERLAVVDRKTVRRYVTAAVDAGVCREGGEGQLDDMVMGVICERVRPHRPGGHGPAWEALAANHALLKGWLVDEKLTVVKAGELLARRGVTVPERTLHRYALDVVGVGRSARGTTVRVADGEPGVEVQVGFGRHKEVPGVHGGEDHTPGPPGAGRSPDHAGTP
jgi:hypothetical protein